jgi:hypothetical protein
MASTVGEEYGILGCNALCFGETYRLHHQRREVSQVTNSLPPTFAGFLPGLLFNPEDRGSLFLRKVGLSPHYKVLNSEDHTLHSHRCENTNPKQGVTVFTNDNAALHDGCAWRRSPETDLRWEHGIAEAGRDDV